MTDIKWHRWTLTIDGESYDLPTSSSPIETPIGAVSVLTVHHDSCKSDSYTSTCCEVTRQLMLDGRVVATHSDRHCVQRNFSGSHCSYAPCGWSSDDFEVIEVIGTSTPEQMKYMIQNAKMKVATWIKDLKLECPTEDFELGRKVGLDTAYCDCFHLLEDMEKKMEKED